jgi:hypothetical protein
VAELLRAARGVLLDFTSDGALAAAAAPWRDRADLVTASVAAGPVPADGMLIRPDGQVAWAATSAPRQGGQAGLAGRPAGPPGSAEPALAAGLRAALVTWFGSGMR